MKIDSRLNLIRLIRRFVGTNETKRFADKRFAVNLNKHSGHYINEEIIELIKHFNSYINY